MRGASSGEPSLTATPQRTATLNRVSAPLIWPVIGPPVRDGAILIDEDGWIVDVGPATAIPSRTRQLDFPKSVILPGLVNAHTHLELQGFAGQVTEPGFFDWISHLRRAKERAEPEFFEAGAKNGLRECWRLGVTSVGDAGSTGAGARALSQLGGRGVFFQEVFGPDDSQARSASDELRRQVAKLAREVSPEVSVGVSPHAPYTVSRTLFGRVAEWARSNDLAVMTHVAESEDEVDFVRSGRGPFAEHWKSRGIPLNPACGSTVEMLDQCGLLSESFLAVHLTQASASDLQTLRQRGSAAVLCPRSNELHHRRLPPLRDIRDSGLPLGLGTDSAVSVPDLDLLKEARTIRDSGVYDAVELIELLTLGGARVLGLDPQVGSLEPGKAADLTVISLGEFRSEHTSSIADHLLERDGASVLATFVSGRQVFP